MGNIFLNKRWALKHLKEIKDKAGPRYTPHRNIVLPITENFEGISRTETFYTEIRSTSGNLRRQIESLLNNLTAIGALKNVSKYRRVSEKLLLALRKIRRYDTRKIEWRLIEKEVGTLFKYSSEITSEVKGLAISEKDKIDRRDSALRSLRDVEEALFSIRRHVGTSKAQLANVPYMLLLGEAGVGKTHLLCDVISARIYHDPGVLPTVLVFGEELDCTANLIPQLIKRAGLQSKINSEAEFWRTLDEAGKVAGCRSILILDAANEMARLKSCKRLVRSLHRKVKRFPNVALVISVRKGFEDLFINKGIKKDFITIEHLGFEHKEWEAVTFFFNQFNLPLPEIPILAPEFQNPLFLTLFYKAFENRSKLKQKDKKREVFRGHEGATYIFEHFVKSIGDRLASKHGFSAGRVNGQHLIWDSLIKEIAKRMVSQNSDRVPEAEVLALIKHAHPQADAVRLLKDLEVNLLLVKVPNYDLYSGEVTSFSYRFPFQKFSDHLIARYIFEEWRLSRQAPRDFFAESTPWGKYLSQSWNRGLTAALMIQCPENLQGEELIDVAPYLRSQYHAAEAFIESIIWRKPERFKLNKEGRPERTLELINDFAKKDAHVFNSALNAFITVSGCIEHPLNGRFLHKWLLPIPMPRRDSFWSTFLHHDYGRETAVDRLLDWAWSAQSTVHINEDAIELLSTALAWFLSTPNRAVRDKATKGLVSLLTIRLSTIVKLLTKFEKINDPYILERLYAVAYGCALRNQSDRGGLKLLAVWVYKTQFKKAPYPHFLLRDYARGIVEVALRRKISLKVDLKRIVPPYKSKWIKDDQTEEELKKKYDPPFEKKKEDITTADRGMWRIWFSVIGGGDFDRYVIGTNSHHSAWTGRMFGRGQVDRKKLFQQFIKSLSGKQRQLWAACDPIISDDNHPERRIGSISIKVAVGRKKEEEVKAAIQDFKDALPIRKRNLFEQQIYPYLDHNLTLTYNPAETFDLRIAQRWILQRVYDLGWDSKLHAEFDLQVDDRHNQGRASHKPERIGKKYQWIAFHEFMARISDNFEFKGEWNNDGKRKYNGPWEPFERDIDPSFILRPDLESPPIAISKLEKGLLRYTAWAKRESDESWVKNKKDMPSPRHIIEFKDDKGDEWLLLDGFIRWEEPVPPEEDRYKLRRREMWYMIRSYFIPRKKFGKGIVWARQQHFMGRWMPEARDFYEVFLGEYPFSPAYQDVRPNAGRWVNERGCPFSLMLTNDNYLNEITLDCSLADGCSINLPSKFIIKNMKLVHKDTDGRFYDAKGQLIASALSIWRKSKITGLVIRKASFLAFLKRSHYCLFWTFLSERNAFPPTFSERGPSYRGEMSGIFQLSDRGRILGKPKVFKFISNNTKK
jgi:hypothetical protein